MGHRNMGKGCCSLLSLLFFTTLLFIASNAYSQNDWIRSLNDHTPQERIKYSITDKERDNELSGRTVQLQHSIFTLDKSFVPLIKKDKGHILIQLTRPLDNAMKEVLSSYQVELLQYIPSNAWKARIPARNIAKVKSLDFVYAMGNIHSVDKFPKHLLETGLSAYSFNSDGSVSIMVTFHKGIQFKRALEIIAEITGTTEQVEFLTGEMVLIRIHQEKMETLSEFDEVNWIEDRPTPKSANNINAAALSNVDDVQISPYNLNGSGIKIGEWDEGPVQSDHPDLSGRVTVIESGTVSSHATHVGGTMIGSGLGDANAKGMAIGASIYSYDFNGDVLAEKSSAVSTYGIQLANNSWGYINGWQYNFYGDLKWVWFGDANFGAYISQSKAWDQTVIDTNLVIVKSAGNDRADYGDTSQSGHHHYGDLSTVYTDYHPTDSDYDSIGEIGNAKNIITVGAVDDSGVMVNFSSWGPTDDGRVKPDLVANGLGLVSTYPTSSYASQSGTSMSSPVVTGVTALVMHKYLSKFGTYPSPQMVKAMLVNTATDLGNTGPDYSYGWGLLDAKATVDLIIGGSDFLRAGTVSNSATLEYTVTVPSSTPVFKVTAAWTDPAGTPGAAKALVNNIDIELVDPVGGIYRPWKLDPANPSANATRGVNSVDNVEQVLVDAPQAGTWTMRVKGTSIQGSQPYAVVSNIAVSARNEPDISVNTTSNDLGAVKVGSSSSSRIFTVSNTGLQPLTVSTVTVTGSNASEYAKQSDNCSGFTLPSSGTCTVTIIFSPASEGQRSASLSISSDDPDTPTMNVPLSGKGDSTFPVTTPSPKGGTYSARQLVVLTTNEAATVYYTTDGTEPNLSSTVYTSPVFVGASMILKFFAVDSAGNAETVKIEAYTINPPIWTSQIGTAGFDEAYGVATDGNGNVYVTGYTERNLIPGLNNPGDQDIFLIKYDSNGNRLWTVQERSPDWYYESGMSVAVDSSGNIYVAVESQSGLHGYTALGSYDGYLIKYDSGGNRLWTRQIATTAWEDINSVTVGADGNAYVVGGTKGGLDGYVNAGNEDLFIVKFDTDGNKLWTRQIGTTANDYAYGVTENNGNIYVAGDSLGGLDGNVNLGGQDIILVKYDTNGNKIWTKQAGTSATDHVNKTAAANGFIYVTGTTGGGLDGNSSAGSYDIVLIKYDEDGNKIWTKQMGGSGWESGYSLKIDPTGNVYVAGGTASSLDGYNNAGSYDIFLMKFDNSGNKKWTKLIGSLSEDDAYDLALDANSYAYIAGSTWGSLDGNTNSGNFDFFVTKIDTGATVGTIYINGGAQMTNSTVVTLNLSCYDATGNCAEMMFSSNGINYSAPEPYASSKSWTIEPGDGLKMVYVKFKNNSAEWSNPYWDTINLETVPPVTVASPTGGSFVVAQSVTLSANETATIYYTTDGSAPTSSSPVYSTPINISSTTILRFFAKDSAGNSEALKTEVYIIDINAAWTKQVGTSKRDVARDVARDAQGNIYVAGYSAGSLDGNINAGNDDIFLIKYDKNGNRFWTRQIGSSNFDYVENMTLDGSGNAYITGYTYGGIDGNTNLGSADIFLVKYDSVGNKLWTRQMGTSNVDYVHSVRTDNNGNVFVVGRTFGGIDGNTSVGNYDLFIVKFDSNGNKLWTKQRGTTSSDGAYSVAADSDGSIFVAGYTAGSLDGNVNAGGNDIFLIKYDNNGNWIWTRQYGSSSYDDAYSLSLDGNGYLYITGITSGALNGTNAGLNDIFLVKYDTSGNWIWTRQKGTTNYDEARAITTDNIGNIYVTGYTSGSLDGNVNAGLKDIALLKYDSGGNWLWTKQMGSSSDDFAYGLAIDRGWNIDMVGYTKGGLNGNTNKGLEDIFWIRIASDDITSPTGSILINSGDTYINSTSVTLTLSCDDGNGSGCAEASFSNDNINWSAPETFATSKPLTLSSGDGTKTVYVRYLDYSGNVSESFSDSITLDTTVPDTSITSNPANPSGSGSASFSFSATETAIYQCQMDSEGYSSCSNPKSYTGLTDGSHTFDVKATDTAGNVDSTPASYTWTVDTAAPDTSITASPANPANRSSATFSFSATETATYQCQMDSGGYGSCSSPKSYTGLTDGSHTFYIKATDMTGNTDLTPVSYSWVVDTTPPSTTASPSGGVYTSSQSVTLNPNETATTYYCLYSGCIPTTIGTSVSLAGSTVLRYYSKDTADNSEAVKEQKYTIVTAANSLAYTGGDTGAGGNDQIAGVKRLDSVDGSEVNASDANNMADGKATIDMAYSFEVAVNDTAVPISVKLHIADRPDPVAGNVSHWAVYSLVPATDCTGAAWTSGKICKKNLKLGPAPGYMFYYEVVTNSNGIRYLPGGGSPSPAAGPSVKRLNGWSMLSVPRNIGSETAAALLGSSTVYRWVSTGPDSGALYNGSYQLVTTGLMEGESYFVMGSPISLPNALSTYNSGIVNIPVKEGWNLIGNPFNYDLVLNNTNASFAESVSLWSDLVGPNVGNMVYEFDGSEWGSTYNSTQPTDGATLVPWMGYWIYISDCPGGGTTCTLRLGNT